jgi:hypothetical protein
MIPANHRKISGLCILSGHQHYSHFPIEPQSVANNFYPRNLLCVLEIGFLIGTFTLKALTPLASAAATCVIWGICPSRAET